MTSQVRTWAKYAAAFLLIFLGITIPLTETHNPAVLCLVGYGIGSLPFGYLLTKLFAKQDVRSIGSGNIGATNVLRTGNKTLAILTLLLDVLKGTVAVLWLSRYTATEALPFVIAMAVLVGHLFPVWLDFKGGKGVAPGLGVLLALSWPLALCTMGLWLFFVFIFKYSSLAALLTVTILPLIAVIFINPLFALFTLVLGLLIVIRHKDNIRRLTQGKEPKIGQR